jgi:hypothetical protein
MKLLKKQKGLPFLLALGVLFILSASFLAVQLWSERSFRGALLALEAPTMPPAMPKVIAPPAEKKSPRKSRAASETARPDSLSVAVREASPALEEDKSLDSAAAVSINNAAIKTEVLEAPAVVEVKAAEPMVKESTPVQVVRPEPRAEKKIEKIEKKAPAIVQDTAVTVSSESKPRKSRKARVEEIPTEVPAEWNWFSKPLRVALGEGKARIEPDSAGKEIKLSDHEKIRFEPVTVESKEVVEMPSEIAPVQVDVEADAANEARVSEVPESAPATEKPFMIALARMARIKQMRQSHSMNEKKIEKPSREVSPSMRRLGDVIKVLCDRLDKRVAATQENLSSIAGVQNSVVASSEDSVVAVESNGDNNDNNDKDGHEEGAFKPYYGGSGSSFSQRINSMIRSGLVKVD